MFKLDKSNITPLGELPLWCKEDEGSAKEKQLSKQKAREEFKGSASGQIKKENDYVGDIDVMAVILDATQAYQKNSNIWTVRIKLIDHTMQEPVTLLMFAFTPKELPTITALGDILYIKNAKLDSYQGRKNIVWNARA